MLLSNLWWYYQYNIRKTLYLWMCEPHCTLPCTVILIDGLNTVLPGFKVHTLVHWTFTIKARRLYICSLLLAESPFCLAKNWPYIRDDLSSANWSSEMNCNAISARGRRKWICYGEFVFLCGKWMVGMSGRSQRRLDRHSSKGVIQIERTQTNLRIR